MKRKKILLKILSLTFALCVVLGLCACVYQPTQKTEQPKASYEQINGYTLVLNEYYIQNPEKVIKIVDPQGSEVEFSENPFVPTSVGEYQIVYENKTEKLTVLVKSESLTFTINDTFADEYVAGNTISIPTVTVKDDFKTYTAYSVTVKNGDKIVGEYANVNQNIALFVELSTSGEYTIEYTCIDGFGQVKKDSVEFTVIDQPTIIYEQIEQEFSYGDTVEIGSPFGFYKGKKYAVNLSVETPTQGVKTLSDGAYTFNEDGKFILTYSCDIDGQVITETKELNVNYTAKNIANTVNGEIFVGEDLPEYSKEKGKGVLVKGLSNFTFNYEPIIDLNKLDKNINLISFVPYSDTNTSLTELTLTLTDVYDENNSLTFYWYAKEHWGIDHSYLALKRPNGDYGLSNERSDGAKEQYGKIRPEGAVVYESSFFGKQNGSSATFNLQYDISENKAYCVVQGNQWLLIDADNEPEIAFEDRFYGFTTGEVYLSIKTLNNNNAGVYITEIAGEDFAAKSIPVCNFQEQFAILSKTEEQLPIGQANISYPIPEIKISDNCTDRVEFNVDVFYQGEKQNFETNGKFIPKQSGSYSAVYKAVYKGIDIEKTVNFDVVDSLGEITVDFPEQSSVISGSTYKVPNFTVSGVSKYQASVKVKDSKQIFETNMFGEFVLNTNENAVVEIVVQDTQLPDRRETFTFEIPVVSETVLTLNSEMPKRVRAGAKIELPDFTVYNSSSAQTLDKQIVINKGKSSQVVLTDSFSYEVPKNLEKITVTFVGGAGTEYESDMERYTYDVQVISENADSAQLLGVKTPNTAKLISGENGLIITASSSGNIFEMPYSLPTTELLFKFSLRASKMNYSAVKIILTDSNRDDKQVVLTLTEISNGSAKLKINSDTTDYQLKYSVNGGLYDFSLIFNQTEKAILNSSNKVVAKINTFADGTSFNGFSNKLAYLSAQLENVTSTSEFVINEVANQQFGYYMSAFGKKDNDNNGPVIYSDFVANTIDAEYGSAVYLPKIFAKDVLQTSSTLTLSVVDPNGDTIKKNVNASLIDSIQVDKYGKYNLVYTAKDSLGNKTEKRITVNVKDLILPTIEVAGSYKAEYEIGSSVTIANAIATDNNTTNVSLLVLMIDSAGTIRKVEFGDKVQLNREGSYKIIYRAEDEYFNVKTQEFNFNVNA